MSENKKDNRARKCSLDAAEKVKILFSHAGP